MEQFTVPQFIDAEDKIIGPITARQFIILLVAILINVVLYKLLPFVVFIIFAVLLMAFAGVIAFTKINGMPFHFFMLNLVQTFKRPQLRIWDKTLTDAQIRDLTKEEEAPPPPPPERKVRASKSRLREMTMVVNTGGVYNPDEQI